MGGLGQSGLNRRGGGDRDATAKADTATMEPQSPRGEQFLGVYSGGQGRAAKRLFALYIV